MSASCTRQGCVVTKHANFSAMTDLQIYVNDFSLPIQWRGYNDPCMHVMEHASRTWMEFKWKVFAYQKLHLYLILVGWNYLWWNITVNLFLWFSRVTVETLILTWLTRFLDSKLIVRCHCRYQGLEQLGRWCNCNLLEIKYYASEG